MLLTVQSLLADYGISPASLLIFGVGFGAILAFLGLSGAFSGTDPVLRRLAAQGGAARSNAADRGLLHNANPDPKGLLRSLIPSDRKERTLVHRQLVQAGLTGPNSLRNYYLVRVGFGLLLPLLLLGAIASSRAGLVPLPASTATLINGLSRTVLMQGLAILVAIGFFGPIYWLRGRSGARRRDIEEAFPNALDLIQISVESGLGFDAAMIRVGNELTAVAPAISQELLIAQREIQAGRSRDRALTDMAQRTQVEEVTSFVSVVLQSMQFGTSISEVLNNHAQHMRGDRELRAQEQANKLPVKMSAVMASLMLPALLLLSLGPVAIRYVRYFAN